MMRKRLLVLLLILFITLCSSCKKQNSDFVDISFDFQNHLKETYPFIGQHVQIKLFEKSQLKNSQYKELYDKYSHLDFQKIIVLNDKKAMPLVVQFNSTQSASDAYINFGELYFQYNNCICLDINISYYFLMNKNNAEDFKDILIKCESLPNYIFESRDHKKISGLSFSKYSTILLLYPVAAEIGVASLYGHSGLSRVVIPSRRIGSYAFWDANFDIVYIDYNIDYIDECAFNKGNILIYLGEKPKHWPDNFACGDAKVYWGNEFYWDGKDFIIKWPE